MLKLGHTDSHDDPVPTGSMWAAIHGDSHNEIRHIHKSPEQTILDERVCHKILRHVNFEEPFCDIGDKLTSSRTASSMIRALVLYYFLAAGYIEEIGDYNTFWKDFGKACGWVARNGERPKPGLRAVQGAEGNQVPTSDVSSYDPEQISPVLDRTKSEPMESVDTQVKRAIPEANMTEYSTPKRSRIFQAADNAHCQPPCRITTKMKSTSNTTESTTQTNDTNATHLEDCFKASEADCARLKLQLDAVSANHAQSETRNRSSTTRIEELTTRNTDLQTQNSTLTTRIHELQTQQDYDQNAYNGLKHKYDQLLLDTTDSRQANNKLEVEYNDLKSRTSVVEATSKVQQRENDGLRSTVQDLEAKLKKTIENVQRLQQLLKKELGELDREYGEVLEDE
ncbi:hypothetical protein NX059_000666 [Plenodomus lindquistii]|nr:hypothetical protein NX059_000666 [Plenodomus lindquistii]